MKLALAQFGVSPPPSFKAFITRIERLASEAAMQGADLLALPEYSAMVLAGASVHSPNLAAERDAVVAQADELVAALQTIAARHRIYLLGGTLPMRDADGHIRNRAPFIGPSGTLAFQDKQAMTRFEAEQWGITGGQGPVVFNTRFGPIGVSICYDAEFPLHVRAQVTAGARLMLIPSCTDSAAGFNRVRLSARARAIENQCYAAVIPLVGQASWSAAIDANHGYAALYTPCDAGFPDNGTLATGELNAPALLFTKIDLSAIDAVRAQGNVLNHRDWVAQIPPAAMVELG
jgi:predicted amidohydrolase